MNNHIYSTDLDVYELFEYIKHNKIEIYNIKIKEKITFHSNYKYHTILLKNNKISYLYTISFLGMFLRFFKIYKILPTILSILLFFIYSNMIFEIDVIGDSIEHKNKIIDLLNVEQLPYLSNSNRIKTKLKSLSHELNWFEVIQKGSKIKINYLPRINNNNNVDNKIDLIASKDAIIASFDVLSGNKIVKINQKVNKGDLLISQYDLENPYDILGNVYGYTFKKIELEVNKNKLPLSLQYYLLLLRCRMSIDLDENEKIVKEISLHFSEESNTIRIINFYVLYEMISIIGENNG